MSESSTPTGATFALVSAVRQTVPAVPGRFAGTIAPGWDILGNTNGGYLLAMLTRAMGLEAERPIPVTVTGHFLAPGTAQGAEITAEVLKSGKRLATVSGTLSVGGTPLVTALGAFRSPTETTASLLTDSTPPELPPIEDAFRMRLPPGVEADSSSAMPPPFMDRIDLRLHPEDAGFALGTPSGSPRMRAWFRLLDDEPIDAYALILAADCLPPTIFNSGLPIGWTPTVEFTVHIRAQPADGWLRLDYRTRFISDGLLEVDGVIWDSQDRVVAQSRQLALLPGASTT